MKRNPKPPSTGSPPVRKSSEDRLRQVNAQLAEFVKSCPVDERNPAECPLFKLRKQKAEKVAAWIEGLSLDEKEYLLLYHHCCLATKTQSGAACSC